jgi:MFS family permease
MGEEQAPPERWYKGTSRHQWLVLVLASLGWIFDVFEGQLFVAGSQEVMRDLRPAGAGLDAVPLYNGVAFAAFLLGGALGGVFFGWLGDHLGRTRTLILTILTYSLCTCLSALSQTWWQMALFRFLVAMGVGGEWAVATALVAEVFPLRARARSLAIFHASSVLGTLLAAAAGIVVVGNEHLGWRWAFVLGAAPALLVLWIRWSLPEPLRRPPEDRQGPFPLSLQEGGRSSLTLRQVFQGRLLRHTLVGVGLATVGLATFWGTHIYGKDRLRRLIETTTSYDDLKSWEMAGMVLVTLGGGLGLIGFGPLAERLGRRGAFLFYHAGGLASALLLFLVLDSVPAVLLFLPLFGFLTLGMHAGYAVYFPELFPTALRSTGAGLCFNAGRILAAPILLLRGWLQSDLHFSLEQAAALLAGLYLAGIALLAAAPETRGEELPE